MNSTSSKSLTKCFKLIPHKTIAHKTKCNHRKLEQYTKIYNSLNQYPFNYGEITNSSAFPLEFIS